MSFDAENHESEQNFETYVETVLEREYKPPNVHRQYGFPSGRVADFVVHTPWNMLAVELENDAGSVLNGSGQAQAYAQMAMGEWPDAGVAYPLLVVPDGHIDAAECRAIERSGVGVREIAVPEAVSVEGV